MEKSEKKALKRVSKQAIKSSKKEAQAAKVKAIGLILKAAFAFGEYLLAERKTQQLKKDVKLLKNKSKENIGAIAADKECSTITVNIPATENHTTQKLRFSAVDKQRTLMVKFNRKTKKWDVVENDTVFVFHSRHFFLRKSGIELAHHLTKPGDKIEVYSKKNKLQYTITKK